MAGGRPSKYQDAMLEQAYKLALLGAKDEQISDFFHINIATLSNWKVEKPEFLEALKEGKLKADSEVADSLYNRALGYEYMEQQAHKLRDGKDENGGIIERLEIIEVKRVVPPDTTACIFWLKNRQKEQWREKIELGGDKENPIQHTHNIASEILKLVPKEALESLLSSQEK